ncbi:HesA/MoeB/ThiF family protein [Maritalea porphyrae]|uniref:HesA/MoeB/ThiF family protein n=1 Tax=Maritalea porphyrae TaxID=880732 RepID=UPI0022B034B0|nr:HesA/MoeB/ThiF family protein [Maritalea porphyrae]MCZ4272390.1 HesA/MoeB/ThiF family protein [Maritalea porphyrae]
MSRYQRQMQMAEIGSVGQEKLGNARVVIVGAGGLGHPILSYLAGAGVGELHIVDPDEIEFSNLHRQPLFGEGDIGQSKAEVAAQKIRKNNKDIEVIARPVRLDPANVQLICEHADVVVDAADSFAVTYVLSDFCRDQNIALISASVLGFEGYVGGFCGGVAPSIRAVFPQLPMAAQSCASAGVSGAAVGVMGSLQAQLVINVLLDLKPNPLGQMLRCDFKTFQFSRFSFLRAPEPLDGFTFISPTQISPKDRVIELRTNQEAPFPVVPHAKQMVAGDIENLAIEDERIVIVCRTGLRAWNAGLALQQKGGDNIVLVATG